MSWEGGKLQERPKELPPSRLPVFKGPLYALVGPRVGTGAEIMAQINIWTECEIELLKIKFHFLEEVTYLHHSKIERKTYVHTETCAQTCIAAVVVIAQIQSKEDSL